MTFTNIFVTVGTTKFDKLIETLLDPICLEVLTKRGCKNLKLQIGEGSPPTLPSLPNLQITFYRYKTSISKDLSQADLVVSHAGAGSCLETLEAGKPLLVVINEDLLNNHQTELALKFSQNNFLFHTTCTNLVSTLQNLNVSSLEPYKPGDPKIFMNYIDKVVGFVD